MDKYDYDEVRIGMLGNVDAGKSTIIGVLTNGILDDGRGSARKNIMRYPHEIECGQTSSVVQHHIRCSDKLVTLTDMAGHEKYFRTTVNGIKRCFVEFAGLVIGANKGIGLDKTETSNVKGNRIYVNMTKEHISLINALNLPTFLYEDFVFDDDVQEDKLEKQFNTQSSLPQEKNEIDEHHEMKSQTMKVDENMTCNFEVIGVIDDDMDDVVGVDYLSQNAFGKTI